MCAYVYIYIYIGSYINRQNMSQTSHARCEMRYYGRWKLCSCTVILGSNTKCYFRMQGPISGSYSKGERETVRCRDKTTAQSADHCFPDRGRSPTRDSGRKFKQLISQRLLLMRRICNSRIKTSQINSIYLHT